MKKFLPAIFISMIFTLMMISQMLINGQELSASRVEQNKERFSLYEDQFHKFNAISTKGTNFVLKNVNSPIVIVNFWASWCTPCIAEFKSLNRLKAKFGDSIKIIGINNDTEDEKKAVAKIETKYNLPFESILDPEGKFAQLFNISKVPSSIIFFKGKVIEFSAKEFDFMSESFINLLQSKLKN